MMSLSTWLLILCTVIIAVVLKKVIQSLWWVNHVARHLRHVPVYLPKHWLYGNLHHRKNPNFFMNRAKWGSDNGVRLSQVWFGPTMPAIVVHHPDILKEILNKPKPVGVYSKLLGPWMGSGLLNASGQRWARNRKLLTGAFHFETIKPYVRIYNECSDVLVKKWTECVSKGTPIPVFEDISRMTLDILLQCSFSHNTNCQIEDFPYTKAIQQLLISVRERASSLYRIAPNFFYLNFTSHGKYFKRKCDYIHAYAEKLIAQKKHALAELETADSTADSKTLMAQALQSGNRRNLDFLDILLMARDEEGRGLSDLEIRYEVDTFMFAGQDTTAHGLAWTLYCLAKHPEHQERCREEINEVFGDKDHLEYSDLSKLSYTLWCIKESMRVYPPVFVFVRELTEDTMIDGHMIPKGTLITVSTIAIHHNKEFWPDPEVFDPLRFHPDRISKQHPYAYAPFSAGPRNCIGQNFAMNEMRVALPAILRKFKLSLIDDKPLEVRPLILYGFKDDVPINIELID